MPDPKIPDLGTVNVSDSQQLQRFVDQLREIVQTREGRRGSVLQRGVTFADLLELGLVDKTAAGRFVGLPGGGSTVPGPPGPPGPPGGGGYVPDLTPPPAAVFVGVTPGWSYLFVEWVPPVYTAGNGHAYTEVWAAQYDGTGPLPTFDDAKLVSKEIAPIFAFQAGLQVQVHFWLINRSNDGVAQATPTGGINGVYATTTGIDVGYLLDTLEGQITESQLYAALTDRINLIDAPDTVSLSVAWRVRQEALARAAALAQEAADRAQAIADAEQAAADALAVETGNRVAAILQEQSDRAAAIQGVFDDLTLDIAGVTTTLRSEFAAADASTLSLAQSFTYSRAAIDAADAGVLNTVRTEFAAADATTLSLAQEFTYSRSTIDSAVAGATTTLRAEFAAADAVTLASAQTFTYSRAAIDAADAATLTTLRAEFAAADAVGLLNAQSYVQSYGYSFAGANTAIANAVNTVSARLNTGGDVYNSIVTVDSKAQSALDGLSTQASQITLLQSGVNLRNRTFNQASAPVSDGSYTLQVNDRWRRTSDGREHLWNGTAWVETSDARIANTLATLLNDYSTTATMNSAIATASTTLRAEFAAADSTTLASAQSYTNTYAYSKAEVDGQVSSVAGSVSTLAVQLRGNYTGTDLNAVSSGLIHQERVARVTLGNSLTQQISLLSAGSNNQFDYAEIWYYDSSVEGWSGSGVVSAVDGWIRQAAASGTVNDPNLISPDNLNVDGTKYPQVRMRIRKVGTPTWEGKVYYTTTADTVFNEAKQIALAEPSYDAGIALLTFNMPAGWLGATIRRIRIDLASAISTTSYFEIDWVAVGRPSPGASSAQLLEEQEARAAADSAQTTARETLATQLRGAYTGTDIAFVSAGLIASEKNARVTADSTEVSARQALSAKITGVNDPASLTLATLSSGLLYDERQARVSADSAQVGRLDALEATVNNPTTGVTATASALDTVELIVNNGTTGNVALGSRTSLLESSVNTPSTGLLARASVLESRTTNASSGNVALANRAAALEASVNSPTSGNNPTYARLLTEESVRAALDGSVRALHTVRTEVSAGGQTVVGGFGLAGTATAGQGPRIDFGIAANRFFVAAPAGSGVTGTIQPFVIQTTSWSDNGVTRPAGLYVEGAYIKNLAAVYATIQSLVADQITAADITVTRLLGGTMRVGAWLESTNYTPGPAGAGFRLNADGTAFLQAAYIRGQLTASQIDSRGLSIRDAAGNVILSAGASLAASTINLPGTITGVPLGWRNDQIAVVNGVLTNIGSANVQVDNSYQTIGMNLIAGSDQAQGSTWRRGYTPNGADFFNMVNGSWPELSDAVWPSGVGATQYVLRAGTLRSVAINQTNRQPELGPLQPDQNNDGLGNTTAGDFYLCGSAGLMDIPNLGNAVACPVVPGERICASVFLAAHRCRARVFIVFQGTNPDTGAIYETYSDFGDMGAPILKADVQQFTHTLQNFTRVFVVQNVPAGVTRAIVGVRKYNTFDGSTDSWLWIAGMQFEKVAPNAAGPSPYMPGPVAAVSQLGYFGDPNATRGAPAGTLVAGDDAATVVRPGNKINNGNISSYLAAGAISNAYIGNFIQSFDFNGTIDANGAITNNGTTGWAIAKGGKMVLDDIVVRQAKSVAAVVSARPHGTGTGVSEASGIAYFARLNTKGYVVSSGACGSVSIYTLAGSSSRNVFLRVTLKASNGVDVFAGPSYELHENLQFGAVDPISGRQFTRVPFHLSWLFSGGYWVWTAARPPGQVGVPTPPVLVPNALAAGNWSFYVDVRVETRVWATGVLSPAMHFVDVDVSGWALEHQGVLPSNSSNPYMV